MTTPPQRFPALANLLVSNGAYRDIDKLWTAVQRQDAALAHKVRALRRKEDPNGEVISRLRAFHEGLRKGGKNRGHRSAIRTPQHNRATLTPNTHNNNNSSNRSSNSTTHINNSNVGHNKPRGMPLDSDSMFQERSLH